MIYKHGNEGFEEGGLDFVLETASVAEVLSVEDECFGTPGRCVGRVKALAVGTFAVANVVRVGGFRKDALSSPCAVGRTKHVWAY